MRVDRSRKNLQGKKINQSDEKNREKIQRRGER